MAQHDYIIANQGFPSFRSDMNNAFAATVTNNSGTSEPTTKYSGMIFADTRLALVDAQRYSGLSQHRDR